MKTYDELLAERDAFAACIESIRQMAYEKNADMLIKYGIDGASCKRLYAMMQDITPQQCLEDIKANAVIEFAKEYGGKFSGLPDFAASAVSLFADQYAAKIRNTGTWLKDSNVNGGKRQGGER